MTTLKKGDEVEIYVTGTVRNPSNYGYVEVDTPAGSWNFHPTGHKITVTKPAGPAWWPPRPGDVAVVNNGSDVVIARREDYWEVVDLTYTSDFPIRWLDKDVLDASPRLIARGRKMRGF